MVTRRNVLIALGISASDPFIALAQSNKVWRVGFLSQRHVDSTASDYSYGPFTEGMHDLGYVEGKNLAIETRSSEGVADHLQELAAELARLKMDVLVTTGTPAALAAQKSTTAIPIVFASVGDPVGAGLVKSLARPGGNITGLANLTVELGPKLLEKLREIVPRATRIHILVNPSNPYTRSLLKTVLDAARNIGVTIQPVEADTPQKIANAFALFAKQSARALIVQRDSMFSQERKQIAAFALKQRLPTIGGNENYVVAGGLLSYGSSDRESWKRVASIVDKIFKGVKPGEIPVELPTTYELHINRKTANLLGLKLPAALIGQATRIIE